MVQVAFLLVPSFWGIPTDLIAGPPFQNKELPASSVNYIPALESNLDIFGLDSLDHMQVQTLTSIFDYKKDSNSIGLFFEEENISNDMSQNIVFPSKNSFLFTSSENIVINGNEIYFFIQRCHLLHRIDVHNQGNDYQFPIPPWPPPNF